MLRKILTYTLVIFCLMIDPNYRGTLMQLRYIIFVRYLEHGFKNILLYAELK
jgi:hypothetical protein